MDIHITQKIISVYGGWKQLAIFLRDNMPDSCRCATQDTLPCGGPIGWVVDFGKARCGYRPSSECNDIRKKENAIALLKASGLTYEEASDILSALRDMGWCRILDCGALIFTV